MVKGKKILEQHSLVTSTREELETLAKCVAASLNPDLFKPVKSSQDVVGIIVNGSPNSFKSGFVDTMAEYILPESRDEHFLSFYDDPRAGQYSSLAGYSALLEANKVTLSYQDQGPETFWERYENPGIHFDQNVRPQDAINPWLVIEIRAPHPDDSDTKVTIFDDLAESSELARLFAYADYKALRRVGLIRSFQQAQSNEQADMPRFVTFKVLDPRLAHDAQFQNLTTLLTRIKQQPGQSSELLSEAQRTILRPPSPLFQSLAELGKQVAQREPEPLLEPYDDYDLELRIQSAQALSEITPDILEKMSLEQQQGIQDLLSWYAYYQRSTGEDPSPSQDHDLKPIQGRRFQIHDMVFDTGRLHAYIPGSGHQVDLSQKEGLLLESLLDDPGLAEDYETIAAHIFKSPEQHGFRTEKRIAQGLRKKLADYREELSLKPLSYIETERGVGFYIPKNSFVAPTPDRRFDR